METSPVLLELAGVIAHAVGNLPWSDLAYVPNDSSKPEHLESADA